jgi:hypothetical protein
MEGYPGLHASEKRSSVRISRLKARLTRSDSRVECVDRQLPGDGWKMLAVHEWGCLGLWGCQHGGRGISIRHANCSGKRHVSKMFFLSLIAHTQALLEDLWRGLSKSSTPPGRSPRKPKGILFDCGKKFARWSPSRRARRRPIANGRARRQLQSAIEGLSVDALEYVLEPVSRRGMENEIHKAHEEEGRALRGHRDEVGRESARSALESLRQEMI